MPDPSPEVIRFKRNHFTTRLPVRFLYCPSHFWLSETSPGEWRVGLTAFATRMLGEIVELDFEVREGDAAAVGDVIGWIEGFKAVSDVFAAAGGEFGGPNPDAARDAERICRDPYGEGWLYSIRGQPDPRATDVGGYVEHLDRTIDAMLEKPWRSAEIGGP